MINLSCKNYQMDLFFSYFSTAAILEKAVLENSPQFISAILHD